MILWIYLVCTTDWLVVDTLFYGSVKLQSNYVIMYMHNKNLWDYLVTHCANPVTLSEIALEIEKDK